MRVAMKREWIMLVILLVCLTVVMLYYAFSEGNLTKDLDTDNILRYAAFSAIIILIAKRKFKGDDEKEERQETKEEPEE